MSRDEIMIMFILYEVCVYLHAVGLKMKLLCSEAFDSSNATILALLHCLPAFHVKVFAVVTKDVCFYMLSFRPSSHEMS